MNPTAPKSPHPIDLEICPGLDSLVSQRAACGPSRRSAENTRTRKRLGRAIRKALAPLTTQIRRLSATWTVPDEIDMRECAPTAEDFMRALVEEMRRSCRDVPTPGGIPADVAAPMGFIYVPEGET